MNFLQTKSIWMMLPIYLLALSLVACSSNPEKEKQRWAENLQKNQAYQTTYPTMKMVLTADRTQAQQMWNTALKVSDAKAQVKAMQDANTYLSGIPNQLSSLEAKFQRAERKIKELGRMRTINNSQDMARDRKIDTLIKTIDQSRAALRRDPQVDHMTALTYLRNLNSRVSSTISTADRMIRRFRKQKNKVRAAAKALKNKLNSKSKSTKSKSSKSKTQKK